MASTTRLIALASALLFAACAGSPSATECATGITCPAETQCAAVQPVCITNDCGDGIHQQTEKCDDGNILDGDGCAANCLSTETCGDGVINSAAGEICDDSNTTGGDGCATDCRSVEVCGNGIRDVTEVCDDGNTMPGDGCNGTCTSTEICGNGIKDVGEICDDEGMPGGCNNDCQGGTGCGDGAIDKDASGNPIEECDDGNSNDQDDCRKVMVGVNVVCRLAQCGDGVEQTSGSRVEGCDPGAAGETAGCNADCTDNTCGDGVVNHTALEQCDDGAMNSDSRDCTALCKYNFCGDTKVNTMGTGGEQCDDGNGSQMDGCSNICTLPTCGNNIIEMGEACDDGNTANNDGCSGMDHALLADCQFESCGDGVVNNGETCNPGPAFETTSCNSDCTPSVCGDQKVNHADGEQCEEMNTTDDDACRPPTHPNTALRCTLNVCGDGSRNPLTEACDDNNTSNLDACTNSCMAPTCGDGIINGSEPCDDGNNGVPTDGCRDGCILPTCGDGIVWAGVEECDLGMSNSNTGNCTLACTDSRCGDGFVDSQGSGTPQTELCDDGNNTTESICPYGTTSCTFCNMGCDATTTIAGNICGDGVTSVGNEMCDDGNRVTEATCAYGLTSCPGACSANCQTPLTPAVAYCGDGATQSSAGEGCDDRSPTQSCGRCDNACNVFIPTALAATGLIIAPAVSALDDNDRFTLSDGFGITKVFEFDANANGISAMADVEIDVAATDTAGDVRNKIKTAIVTSGIAIAPTDAGATGIKLTNNKASSLGNQPVDNDVDTTQFFIQGMTGGAAGNCPAMTPCNNAGDCASGVCTSNVCQ